MIGPDLDLNEKNLVGAIDRLVVNVGLAFLSVVPTLCLLIAMPGRMSGLLTEDEPDGRKGLILAPGIFFIAAVTLALLFAGVLATPGTIETNSGLIGPAYAKSVSLAVAEGDVWKAASLIGPIYVLSVFVGGLGRCFGVLAGPAWTLKTSLRASLYHMATAVCWIIISGAVIYAAVGPLEPGTAEVLFSISTVVAFLLPIWQYFWFFRRTCDLSVVRSSLLAIGQFAIIVGVVGALVATSVAITPAAGVG